MNLQVYAQWVYLQKIVNCILLSTINLFFIDEDNLHYVQFSTIYKAVKHLKNTGRQR